MSSIKIKNKDKLDKLQAKITLLLGHKIPQQELVDLCIEFIDKNIDKFIREEFEVPELTEEKVERILNNIIDVPIYYTDKKDDELLYD
ncbi:MAG: hypothetical protein ACTSRP_23425 [Candidatus Helarchaeota archaeon]